jgi:hypothetical protein
MVTGLGLMPSVAGPTSCVLPCIPERALSEGAHARSLQLQTIMASHFSCTLHSVMGSAYSGIWQPCSHCAVDVCYSQDSLELGTETADIQCEGNFQEREATCVVHIQ